jgi:hypothetical protein
LGFADLKVPRARPEPFPNAAESGREIEFLTVDPTAHRSAGRQAKADQHGSARARNRKFADSPLGGDSLERTCLC